MRRSRYSNFAIIIIVLVSLLMAIPSMSFAAPPSQGPLDKTGTSLVNQLKQDSNNEVRISYHAQTGYVRFIGTTPKQSIKSSAALSGPATPENVARGFLGTYGQLFGLKNQKDELRVMSDRTLRDGRSFVRFQQVYQGIPIIGGELIVQIGTDKNIISANGEVLPDLNLDTTPSIGTGTARERALSEVMQEYKLSESDLTATVFKLWIYNPILIGGPGSDHNSLVWRVEVSSVDLLPINELVLVNAQTGEIILHFNQIPHALNRQIYDNDNDPKAGLPGTGPVRTEGDAATGIADVDGAYDFSGDTYNFYWNEHGRDSLDDAGMTLNSTVRYCSDTGCPYTNAFWNGTQMVYGQGYASTDDVVGHELTHGVTDSTSELIYQYQSGAINESFSDVWGEFIDLSNGAGTDDAAVRWLMGEDLPIGPIRDMEDPPQRNDPDRMGSSLYYCVPPYRVANNDQGGVHTNSGVNNKAVYLMTDGDTFNGYTITGIGIPKVADLYYEAQTNLLTSAANYADLYDALTQACSNLGYSSSECKNVENTLKAVEMHKEIVYVDLLATDGGNSSCEVGLKTISTGANAVPNGGIIWIATGNYIETLTITRPMELHSTGGLVTIGQ